MEREHNRLLVVVFLLVCASASFWNAPDLT